MQQKVRRLKKWRKSEKGRPSIQVYATSIDELQAVAKFQHTPSPLDDIIGYDQTLKAG